VILVTGYVLYRIPSRSDKVDLLFLLVSSVFDFISDILVILTQPFFSLGLYILAVVLASPLLELVFLLRDLRKAGQMNCFQWFGLPHSTKSLYGKSLRLTYEGRCPMIANFCLAPKSIASSDPIFPVHDNLFTLLAEIIIQFIRWLCLIVVWCAWIFIYILMAIPWMIVHSPFIVSWFILGTLLHQTNAIAIKPIHSLWLQSWLHGPIVLWSTFQSVCILGRLEESEAGTKSTNEPTKKEDFLDLYQANRRFIVEAMFESFPQFVVLFVSAWLLDQLSIVTYVSMICSLLVVANTVYRIFYWWLVHKYPLNAIPLFGQPDEDRVGLLKSTNTDTGIKFSTFMNATPTEVVNPVVSAEAVSNSIPSTSEEPRLSSNLSNVSELLFILKIWSE
jgi:hypothetical protein